MRYAAVVVLSMTGSALPVVWAGEPTSEASAKSGVVLTGGDGLSREKAVIVRTKSHSGGIASEYGWVREHYPGAKVTLQALTMPIGARQYDTLTIKTAEGRELKLWFDITEFFPEKEE